MTLTTVSNVDLRWCINVMHRDRVSSLCLEIEEVLCGTCLTIKFKMTQCHSSCMFDTSMTVPC
ncbi:hypothetical protein Lalb_Chr16g0386941 [Lupinus albus]|uniref:Uncharacterized protein n=1 Tax=Lupinus albus TaxID=3870 RepID=A0A6A4PCA4_LUPAL|nr:hypothetical protein Lalb_Chr16g0386941 [Lupinus albus]